MEGMEWIAQRVKGEAVQSPTRTPEANPSKPLMGTS
jgi:hypothetical protein